MIDTSAPAVAATGTPDASAGATEAAPEPPGTEVISRVQNQNLEHMAYLRVMSQVDERIGSVVRNQVMPDVGNALDQALARVAADLKASLGDMVRSTVAET